MRAGRRRAAARWAGAALLLASLSGCSAGEGPSQRTSAETNTPDGDAGADGIGAAPSSAVVARVGTVRGDVRWRPSATASWTAASAGQELRAGDAIQTMGDGMAEVVFLASGSDLRLRPNTTLRVPDQPLRVTRFKHLTGRLLARLGPGTSDRMEVELPPGTLILDQAAAGGDGGAPLELEAHVEIETTKTAVTMIKGRGRLERESLPPLAIAQRSFIEVDRQGELVAEGVAPPVIEPSSPADGSVVRNRGTTRFGWIAAEDVDAYLLEIDSVGGARIRHRIMAPQTQAAIELEAGRYEWSISSEVAGRASVVDAIREVTIEVDQQPPRLELFAPLPGATIRSASVQVTGASEQGATVEVNGRAVVVGEDGAFAAVLPIQAGLSNIVVRATDEAGNTRALSRAVLRE